jgi:hypothetical protein
MSESVNFQKDQRTTDLVMLNSFVDKLAKELEVEEDLDYLRDINMLVNKYLLEIGDSILYEKLDEAYQGVTETKSAPADILVSTDEITKNIDDEYGGVGGMLQRFVNRDAKVLDPGLHPEKALLWGIYGPAIENVKVLLDKKQEGDGSPTGGDGGML